MPTHLVALPLPPFQSPVVQPSIGRLHSVALLLTLPLLGPQAPVPASQERQISRSGAAIGALRSGEPGQGAEMSEDRGPYRITAERRALLNTIRYAEGTWIGGREEGYRVLYGGGRFKNLDRHPEIVVRRTYTSAAAGAYQFLPGTWKEAAVKLGLGNFGPASQDQAAIYLVEKRGALQPFDRQGLSQEVLARLAAEWASLPAAHGGSYYGQPVKKLGDLQGFYRAELARQRSGSGGRAPVAG